MLENALRPSAQFRKMANQSVWAIALFIVTYLFLIFISVLLTIVCAYLGIQLIILYTNYITLILGIGLIGFGLLVFFFFIKFMFKRNKMDRSNLLEIFRADEPELFKMIDELVAVIQTESPKKVYISSEVNAAVFYDSSFWSMFFPTHKNLIIGLGLLNTISIDELRAILAHEFGHFSQKSLKVGSYVYYFNRIIYDILYDNESYNNVTRKIATASSSFSFFILASEKVINIMQQILTQVYSILRAKYSKLSHEMEFHADAIAAYTVGSKPLIDSLLRMELSRRALNSVLNYYEQKIELSIKTDDVFQQHWFTMNIMAKLNKMPINNGFPIVDLDYYKRFSHSKLSFEQEYSSHPETEDRIAQLNMLNIPVKSGYTDKALNLFVNKDQIVKRVTELLFVGVSYPQIPVNQNFEAFEEDFTNLINDESFPEVFRDFFDYRNPYTEYQEEDFDLPTSDIKIDFEALFNNESLKLIYEKNSLIADRDTIEKIDAGIIATKTFNYNGQRYSQQDCKAMIDYLNAQVIKKNELLKQLDIHIFHYYYFRSKTLNNFSAFKTQALQYKRIADEFEKRRIIYEDFVNASAFIHTTHPFGMIKKKIIELKKEEIKFKEAILLLIEDACQNDLLNEDTRFRLDDYLKQNYKYFAGEEYFNDELQALFNVMSDFAQTITKIHFKAKKEYLQFLAGMDQPDLNIEQNYLNAKEV